jgi:hypothetical protein
MVIVWMISSKGDGTKEQIYFSMVSYLHQGILRLVLVILMTKMRMDRTVPLVEGPQEENPDQSTKDRKLHGLLTL